MSDWAKVNTEASSEFRPPHAPCDRWPFAGMKLDPLKKIFGLQGQPDPYRITIEGTSHDYLVSAGYMIPYYPIERNEEEARNSNQLDLPGRNEGLIISRATSLISNAQPELGVLRTKEQIGAQLSLFEHMKERNHDECAKKAGQFKIILGAIVKRMETLGRVISQENTAGTRIEYSTQKHASGEPVSEDIIKKLRAEYKTYWNMLGKADALPLLHTVLLTDKKADTDGILIELFRELGKPVAYEEKGFTPDVEGLTRSGIVDKIGYAAKSIDQIHDTVCTLLENEPTQSLFEQSIHTFISTHGKRYNINNTQDVLRKIDHYAALCRARTAIRGDDVAFDEIFSQKDALNEMFFSANGLLESMRSVGRNTSQVRVQKLRDVMSDALKLMDRTGYTRIPCNENAPEPWIPNLSDTATPMEQYLADQLLSEKNRNIAKKKLQEAELLPEEKSERFLRKEFSSYGWLCTNIKALQTELQNTRASLLTTPEDPTNKVNSVDFAIKQPYHIQPLKGRTLS